MKTKQEVESRISQLQNRCDDPKVKYTGRVLLQSRIEELEWVLGRVE